MFQDGENGEYAYLFKKKDAAKEKKEKRLSSIEKEKCVKEPYG
jgi:hypothetical protein